MQREPAAERAVCTAMPRAEITFTRVEGEPWFQHLDDWRHVARGVVDLTPFHNDGHLAYVAEVDHPEHFFVEILSDSFPGPGRHVPCANAAPLDIDAWPRRSKSRLRIASGGIKTDIEVGEAVTKAP